MRVFLAVALLFLATGAIAQSVKERERFYEDPEEAEWRRQRLKVEFDPQFNVALGVSSRYLREGWCRNNRPVAVGQVEMSEGPGYLGVLGIYDFTNDVGRRWRFQEGRFYTGVTRRFHQDGGFGDVTVDLGFSLNCYPGHSRENSGEISLGLCLDSISSGKRWNLASSLYGIWDYDEHSHTVTWDLRHTTSFDDEGTLLWDNSVRVYWGDATRIRKLTRCGNAHPAFYSVGLNTGLQWCFRENWCLEPSLELDYIPERQVRHSGRRQKLVSAAVLWGCLKIQRSF